MYKIFMDLYCERRRVAGDNLIFVTGLSSDAGSTAFYLGFVCLFLFHYTDTVGYHTSVSQVYKYDICTV